MLTLFLQSVGVVLTDIQDVVFKWLGGVVWCGVVWFGVVWCGVVWRGVAWCGVVWCGGVWCGVVWCGVVWWFGMWYGVVVGDLGEVVERRWCVDGSF